MIDFEPVMMGRTLVDRAADHRRDQDWLDEGWTRGRVLLISGSKV